MNDENRNEGNELDQIGEQMKQLAFRGAVLSARSHIDRYAEHIPWTVDLRTYLLASLAAQAPIDADNVPEVLAHVMADMEPVIARLELEAAGALDDPFADLPVIESGEETL